MCPWADFNGVFSVCLSVWIFVSASPGPACTHGLPGTELRCGIVLIVDVHLHCFHVWNERMHWSDQDRGCYHHLRKSPPAPSSQFPTPPLLPGERGNQLLWFPQGLYKYTITVNIGIVAVLHRKMFSGTTPTSLKKKEERSEERRREDWFLLSPWIMCGRHSCVLETNHVAVYVKVCTYMCTSLNRFKGVSSGLVGDIIQYTTHLQVF